MLPAANMSTMMFLSVVLMLGGLGGAAASDLPVYGKLIHSDKRLPSSEDGRLTLRKQPHQQFHGDIHRSLDLDSFNMLETPTTRRVSLPTIIKLYPPTVKPAHMHANMPMRFGRESDFGEDRLPNSNPNMPQRFGRSWEVMKMCAKCPDPREEPNPALRDRLGRHSPLWSLFRALSDEQLFQWPETSSLTTSSEEVKMEEEIFRG